MMDINDILPVLFVKDYNGMVLGLTFDNYCWIQDHFSSFPEIYKEFLRNDEKNLEACVYQKITRAQLEEAITYCVQAWEKQAKAEAPPRTPAPMPIKKAPPSDGFIYVIQAGEYFKIGKALSIKSRLHSHQTSNPEKVETVITAQVADYDEAEADLHEIFMGKRHRGEWFKLDADDLEFIKGYLVERKSLRTGGQ
jgi:hypothetical protein